MKRRRGERGLTGAKGEKETEASVDSLELKVKKEIKVRQVVTV